MPRHIESDGHKRLWSEGGMDLCGVQGGRSAALLVFARCKKKTTQNDERRWRAAAKVQNVRGGGKLQKTLSQPFTSGVGTSYVSVLQQIEGKRWESIEAKMKEKGGRCDNFMEKERKDSSRRICDGSSGVMICRTPGVYWIFSKKD